MRRRPSATDLRRSMALTDPRRRSCGCWSSSPSLRDVTRWMAADTELRRPSAMRTLFFSRTQIGHSGWLYGSAGSLGCAACTSASAAARTLLLLMLSCRSAGPRGKPMFTSSSTFSGVACCMCGRSKTSADMRRMRFMKPSLGGERAAWVDAAEVSKCTSRAHGRSVTPSHSQGSHSSRGSRGSRAHASCFTHSLWNSEGSESTCGKLMLVLNAGVGAVAMDGDRRASPRLLI
ncbi:hypothetical protein CC85DRAFT_43401 [Cutaneotrichosporon oleaginosum]|uniref:Uncharacterized protein n=1 Tax=Cutaneotrichosporon oleaginosum TaxID=879819 RepID=A0A0J0XRQ0_9TREE|nr:uncharacterized protein CC85DRAFT_43401 [Cutaneotrichosporon oleaginosum]KLT43768.1 hypothetical protein CC85DRAFT_43401 [Cutaneotrichosporon oleaginosum]TXT05184.1 hypothetical protein COLE_06504 [Cutaneotrichosporon oleaginosum]